MAAADADVEERGGVASYPLPNSKLVNRSVPALHPPRRTQPKLIFTAARTTPGPRLPAAFTLLIPHLTLHKSIRGGTLNINLNACYFSPHRRIGLVNDREAPAFSALRLPESPAADVNHM